jgi:hypothetical protein
MCRINDNGLLGRLISDKIGIIIALPRPYNIVNGLIKQSSNWIPGGLLTHRNSLNMHFADRSLLARQSLGKLVWG